MPTPADPFDSVDGPAPAPQRICVVTPSYNYERYLGACVRSLRDQQESVRHVVVDDGSTDGSWDLLQQEHPHPDRDCFRQPNSGLSATLNAALRRTDADWLSWLNSDDFHLPWTVGTVRRVIDQVPNADLVVGDTVLVDDRSHMTRLLSRGPFDPVVIKGGYNPFHVPSVFWRNAAVPGWRFDESLKLLMDMDLWLALLGRGAVVAKVDAPLSAFRAHAGQISATRRPSDLEEKRVLGRRHDVPALARTTTPDALPSARVRHAAGRMLSGAAAREWRSRQLVGSNADWTSDEPFDLAELAPPPGPLRVHVHRSEAS